MPSNFIAMVYAVLKQNGIDTRGMQPDEAIEKFNELRGGGSRKPKAETTKQKKRRLDEYEAERERQAAKYGEGNSADGNSIRFADKTAARKYFEAICKDWEQSLTDEEKAAIKGYTDRTYYRINEYLRNPNTTHLFKNFNKSEIDNQIRGIDSAIAKFDIDKDLTVYRGTNVLEFGKDLNDVDDVKKLVDKEIVLPGYSSTSTDKNVADKDFDGEVLIKYTVPKGIGRGAYLDFITAMDVNDDDRESEFLLKRNSKIKITAVSEREDGKILVSAEVIK